MYKSQMTLTSMLLETVLHAKSEGVCLNQISAKRGTDWRFVLEANLKSL